MGVRLLSQFALCKHSRVVWRVVWKHRDHKLEYLSSKQWAYTLCWR